MTKLKLKVGKKYGLLTVLETVKRGPGWSALCKCDCGNKVRLTQTQILTTFRSCGCEHRKHSNIRYEKIGKKYGQLTITGIAKIDKIGLTYFNCKCDCGNEIVVTSVGFGNNRPTKSCGCRKVEAARKRNIKNWQDPVYRQRMIELRVECWQDPAYRELMRENMEGYNHNYQQGTHYSPKAYLGQAHYLSSWELSVYRDLDKDATVLLYKSEPFPIPYYWQGLVRNYFPDIFVIYNDGEMKVLEVKPDSKLSDSQNLAKFEVARTYCHSLGAVFQIFHKKSSKAKQFTVTSSRKAKTAVSISDKSLLKFSNKAEQFLLLEKVTKIVTRASQQDAIV